MNPTVREFDVIAHFDKYSFKVKENIDYNDAKSFVLEHNWRIESEGIVWKLSIEINNDYNTTEPPDIDLYEISKAIMCKHSFDAIDEEFKASKK